MHVLIVEDDQRLAQLIGRVLEREGIKIALAFDGDSGFEQAMLGVHDVVILDWMLPGRDGLSIVRAMRAAKLRTGILMLTAREQVEDRVNGLTTGADDYLTKPFSLEELLARVVALDRRNDTGYQPAGELVAGDIIMNLRQHSARRGEIPLALSLTEWNLLEYLLRNRGKLVTREQIFNRVWTYDSDAQIKAVDIYVSHLRRKLKTSDSAEDPIETVRGVGYRCR